MNDRNSVFLRIHLFLNAHPKRNTTYSIGSGHLSVAIWTMGYIFCNKRRFVRTGETWASLPLCDDSDLQQAHDCPVGMRRMVLGSNQGTPPASGQDPQTPPPGMQQRSLAGQARSPELFSQLAFNWVAWNEWGFAECVGWERKRQHENKVAKH